MVNLTNINDNIIANKWKQRYETLSDGIREKLSRLDESKIGEYQLKIIQRKRLYPQIGDVFKINPKDDIILYGVVINNHINNINGDELVLILIFKVGINVENVIKKGIEESDLLISPVMVGKEYWTRGYFYNIDNVGQIDNLKTIGFYSIGKGKFFDEYGNELANIPQLLGTYGVATISGIAMEINQELIIAELI